MLSKIKNKLKKISNILKKKGPFQAIKQIVNESFIINFGSYYVFETILANKALPSAESELDVVIKDICITDFEDIDKLSLMLLSDPTMPSSLLQTKSKILSYIESGDICFCVKCGETVIGCCWAGFKNTEILNYSAGKVGLKKNEVIITRVFVDKGFRRKKVFIHLLTHVMAWAKKEGFVKSYLYVGLNNIGSILTNLKVADQIRVLYHLHIEILGLQFNFFPFYSPDIIWQRNEKL